ncbi:hypothetical protein CLAFUW4_09850 [Fulvia fulva]|uniref:Uncharacterized protein n=1 Tax=Passalora fulva TaxID=5499 RepID=A0A9Q8PHP8_PASFU|nr:uncharacterized protein CLAFUR5_12389 [Fulvia fulva]KAK4615767.1 hypothetical protein CLAFUR4_09856 [Fulvia fulva]KAK4616350.1 hypothetical protein CLAFUR0_09849 [Fulvia fulva]UJO22621.1 hypothetical protein CLAFUR5_12389 [Fulvia fulva]WPV18770.1 hypothetical protein CLAFUW4_09850 [Fulvia fulva]WPV33794.1 hypothetical protein CLAFUW7_09853 [Fulvia fulva]
MGNSHSGPATAVPSPRPDSRFLPPVTTFATTNLKPDDFERLRIGEFYDTPLFVEQLRHLTSRHPNARGTRDLEYGYRLDDMAYIKYDLLHAATLAAINWVMPNHTNRPLMQRELCDNWWRSTAKKIIEVLKKLKGRKLKGSILLDKLEKALNAGNYGASSSHPEGIHYAPAIIAQMPESQRADFETHLEWVLHRVVEVAQRAHKDKFGW